LPQRERAGPTESRSATVGRYPPADSRRNHGEDPNYEALDLLLLGVLLLVMVTLPVTAAVGRFADVHDDSPFAADIEWLADAGITRGCGTDLFCPEDPVTRQQMAAFLHRLAEGRIVNAATADHATTADSAADSSALDGRSGETYDAFVIGDTRAGADQSGYAAICAVEEMPSCPVGAIVSDGVLIAEATFATAAADSVAAVTATTSLSSLMAISTFDVYVWLELDSSNCTDVINAAATGANVRQTLLPQNLETVSVAATLSIPVAGNHSIALCAQPYAGKAGILTSAIIGIVSASPYNSAVTTIYPS
jgi:hypothetical protein